jgi:hypothetical protein
MPPSMTSPRGNVTVTSQSMRKTERRVGSYIVSLGEENGRLFDKMNSKSDGVYVSESVRRPPL